MFTNLLNSISKSILSFTLLLLLGLMGCAAPEATSAAKPTIPNLGEQRPLQAQLVVTNALQENNQALVTQYWVLVNEPIDLNLQVKNQLRPETQVTLELAPELELLAGQTAQTTSTADEILGYTLQTRQTGEFEVLARLSDLSSGFTSETKISIVVLGAVEDLPIQTQATPSLPAPEIINDANGAETNLSVLATANYARIRGLVYLSPYASTSKGYLLRGVQVELWEDAAIDVKLKTVYTVDATTDPYYGFSTSNYISGGTWYHDPGDTSGLFDFGEVYVGSGGKDLYLKVNFIYHAGGDGVSEAGTEKLVVREYVSVSTSNLISAQYATTHFSSGQDALLVGLAIAPYSASNGQFQDEAAHVFYDLTRGYRYFSEVVGYSHALVTAFIDYNDLTSPFAIEGPNYEIYFNRWDNNYLVNEITDSLLHEYAHSVQAGMRGGLFPVNPVGTSNHGSCANTSSVDGLVEGWARFIPLRLNNDPYYHWGALDGTWDVRPNTGGNAACEKDEYTVGAILWDYVEELAPGVSTHTALSYAAQTFSNHDPALVEEYYASLVFDRGYCSQTWTIFSNHGVTYQSCAANAAKPDLIVTNLVVPANLNNNEDVWVTVQVANLSSAASSGAGFYVDIYLDGVPSASCGNPGIAFAWSDILAAGATVTKSIRIPANTLLAGAHQVRAYLDFDCKIAESNENNNLSAPFALSLGTPLTLAPSHDDFDTPRVITTLSYTDTVDVSGATRAADDPTVTACNLAPGMVSVWYSYTPSTATTLHLDTFGSNYDTYLAVWSGLRGELDPVACNDDYDLNTRQSSLDVNLNPNTTYYFEIAEYSTSIASLSTAESLAAAESRTSGWGEPKPGSDLGALDAGGTLVFNASLTTPANDEIQTAVSIIKIPAIFQANTTGATYNVTDPNLTVCNRVAGNASIWYKFTPAVLTTLNLDTFGSNYDTMIGVYSGTPGNLTEVICNDDYGGTPQSAISKRLAAGTYYIVISEHGASILGAEAKPSDLGVQAGGNLKLNVTTFADVRSTHQYWRYVEGFYSRGITVGCSQNPLSYCPDNSVTRAAMSVFMLKTAYGNDYPPTPATGIFTDLPFPGKEWMQPYVEDWYRLGITVGCSQKPLMYCPENTIIRGAISVFILKLKYGNSYVPPAATGIFTDVPTPGKEWMQTYIEDAYKKGFTSACNTSPLRFCPENAVTRGDMAAFLSRAFDIPQKP